MFDMPTKIYFKNKVHCTNTTQLFRISFYGTKYETKFYLVVRLSRK